VLPRPDPLVIAHRGASAYAPEHTFAAWDLALEMGADYLEQDLQLTADGVLVVLHDERLDRTARGEDCSGPVGERTLAELERCEVGSWFLGSERSDAARSPGGEPEPARLFPRQPIPTLDGVLERYGGRGRFYIETKAPERAPGMEEALARVLADHGLGRGAEGGEANGGERVRERLDDLRPPVVLQSFSAASLRRLAELLPGVPRVFLVGRRTEPEALRRRLDEIGGWAQAIGPASSLVDRALVEAAHARCLEVHPYTVNERAEMVRLLALGVDGIFTDRPDVLRDVVDGGVDRRPPPEACG